MKIRVGSELIDDLPRPTPIILVLGIHFSRPTATDSAIGAAAAAPPNR
jgi:hypothetical protein